MESKPTQRRLWSAVVGGLLIVLAAAWAAPFFVSGAAGDGLVKLRRGSSIDTMRDSIAAAVDGSLAGRVATLMRLTGGDVSRRQGAWAVRRGDSPWTVMRALRSGAPSGVKFTFNNVRTRDEFARRWGSRYMAGPEAMLAALNDRSLCDSLGCTVDNVMGLLVPDTYEFYWDVTPRKFLESMKGYHDKFWNDTRRARAAALGLTPMQVTVIASIAEEETANRAERGVVGRLYVNRVNCGMPLQADPTVKFALGDFGLRRITAAMTRVDSPYNTYRVQGLPPGPIRVPERATIDAILDSRPHDYLYMCAREDFSGLHNFAVDYPTHQANARRYQAALNARGIKR